ncbi:MAG: LVIVD repeat-containing protein, partial [Nitrospinota bacterium]
ARPATGTNRPPPVKPAYSHNVDLVAYHDLEARPAFKMALQVVEGRWYLYLAHFWTPGWSVVEVTDPARPELLEFLPGPPNTWTLQVQVADGKMITSLERIPPGWGGDPEGPHEEGIYIWDVAEPARPRRLGHWRTGASGTHRNHYDGGRYVHCAGGAPGFRGNIYRIVDIADPERPVEVGRWWLPEQWEAGGGSPSFPRVGLHGPAYALGQRAYLSYMEGGMIVLDISDPSLPRLVSRLTFSPALGTSIGTHTVVPKPKLGLAVVNSEAIRERAEEPMNYAALVDIRDEKKPRVLSFLPVPEPPPGAPYRSFAERGGRFGPHNQHHPQGQPHLEDREDRVYLTYFNAGLRIYDIGNPHHPREVAWYLPPDPAERRGPLPETLVVQSEDVLVDSRGFIYLTDKNHGLHILRCTLP